jgi:hypothetical protein
VAWPVALLSVPAANAAPTARTEMVRRMRDMPPT